MTTTRPLPVDWAETFARCASRSTAAIARALGCSPPTVRRHRERYASGQPQTISPHGNSAAARAGVRPRPLLCECCHVAEVDAEGWFRAQWLCGDCLRRGEVQDAWDRERLALLSSPSSCAGWCTDASPGGGPGLSRELAHERRRRKWERMARIMQGEREEEGA